MKILTYCPFKPPHARATLTLTLCSLWLEWKRLQLLHLTSKMHSHSENLLFHVSLLWRVCHSASFPPRRLHRLPQCCPSGREVLSVCSYSAHSTCSKGRLNESRVHHSATIHSFTAFPSLLKANSFPLLCFQLMGNLRFVRRWVVLGRVLQRAWRELWALTVLLLLLLLLCTHLGNTVWAWKFSWTEYSSGIVYWYFSAFVSALLRFSRRFSVSASEWRLCVVHPAWPGGSSKTMQGPSGPGPSLWATAHGGRCLALCQTLWHCSHLYIQVHIVQNITASVEIWICG